MNREEYLVLADAREMEAKHMALEFLDGQLPAGFVLSDDPGQMYGNALFRIKPERVVEGSRSIHFLHRLNHRTDRVDGVLITIPTAETIKAVADVYNGREWVSDKEWGIDGEVKSTLLSQNDLGDAVREVVSMALTQAPFVQFEWKRDEHDSHKHHLFDGGEMMGSVWKSGGAWGTSLGMSSETLGNAKVKVEGAAMGMIKTRHDERISRLSAFVNQGVLDLDAPPPGWKAVVKGVDDAFDPWGRSPFSPVFERKLGGGGVPTCDLTILSDGKQFLSAHGGVMDSGFYPSVVEAANVVEAWAVQNGWSLSSPASHIEPGGKEMALNGNSNVEPGVNMNGPNQEQLEAIIKFAENDGTRLWKSALRQAWFSGKDVNLPNGALLRQVRNEHAPWLEKVNLAALKQSMKSIDAPVDVSGLDSDADLRAIGKARITDVGQENVYLEKDGKSYYFKPANNSRFVVGVHDFSNEVVFGDAVKKDVEGVNKKDGWSFNPSTSLDRVFVDGVEFSSGELLPGWHAFNKEESLKIDNPRILNEIREHTIEKIKHLAEIVPNEGWGKDLGNVILAMAKDKNVGKENMNSGRIVTWNTGRQYGSEGQRMAAVLLSLTGQVAFLDVDRMIDGVTNGVIGYETPDDGLIQRFVMDEYDHGRYSSGFYKAPGVGANHEEAFNLERALKGAAKTQEKDAMFSFVSDQTPVVDKSDAILTPVVIGKNRLRGNSEGAMILDDGVDHLAVLRQVLAKEAKAKDVEPTEDWLRHSVSQVLKLYEKGHADWVANKGDTIGWVYEMNLPSGQVLKLGDARVLGMKLVPELSVREATRVEMFSVTTDAQDEPYNRMDMDAAIEYSKVTKQLFHDGDPDAAFAHYMRDPNGGASASFSDTKKEDFVFGMQSQAGGPLASLHLSPNERQAWCESGASNADIEAVASMGGFEKIRISGPKMLQMQDMLDHVLQERIVGVRNELRELGWEGGRGMPLEKVLGDISLQAKLVCVNAGAGQNVVDFKFDVIDVSKPVHVPTVVDNNMSMSIKAMAACVDGAGLARAAEVTKMESAEALGFTSVVEMEKHGEWLKGQQDLQAADAAYQLSDEALARKSVASDLFGIPAENVVYVEPPVTAVAVLNSISEVLDDRYAEKIMIGNRYGEYDGLEINGVRDLHAVGDARGTCCEVDNENPQFFSVYAHLRAGDFGGVECVGDFGTHDLATEYATELSVKYGLPVHDFTGLGRKEIVGAVKEGVHSGKVLDVADGVVIQKIDREGNTVRHEAALLSKAVEVGEVVDIRYQGGKGLVSGKEKTVGITL